MKNQKGYSMIVLVIAITVILILSTSVVSMMQVSREKTAITNFIFDITTVEEEVQDFYISAGTLPVKTFEKVDMNALNSTAKGILSQLYVYDNENYYYVDLSQLGTISLKDADREYIVNEGSLKVYVVNGVEYSSFNDENTKTTYYTLTSNLVNGLEQYIPQDEEMLVVGNPVTWTPKANLRLILPRQSLDAEAPDKESWKDWQFKWDFGPKTEEELAEISDSDTTRNFEYGDLLEIESNGIYSIYVKDPKDKVTVLNVNVTKIDDISPTYKFITKGTRKELQAVDNETGIKMIKYKTLKNYKENVAEAEENPVEDLIGRTAIDYYLLDGVGKDLIYDLEAEAKNFILQRDTIQKALDAETESHNKWLAETDLTLLTPEEINAETKNHDNLMLELNAQLTALYEKYPYLLDIYGKTDESKLVVYVEDYSGNGMVVGHNDFISTEMLADSYNISLGALKS